MIDWDDAFDNSSYVAGSKNLETNLLRKATAFREELMHGGFSQFDLRYGGKERCVFDFFKTREYPETVTWGGATMVSGGGNFKGNHRSSYRSRWNR